MYIYGDQVFLFSRKEGLVRRPAAPSLPDTPMPSYLVELSSTEELKKPRQGAGFSIFLFYR